MTTRNRGHTLVEAIIATSVFLVLAGAGLVGGQAHLREIGHSFDRLAATKAATSRLEALAARPDDLVEGERGFDPGRPGTIGLERITRREPGLYEVVVRVSAAEGPVAVQMTTLIAREEPR